MKNECLPKKCYTDCFYSLQGEAMVPLADIFSHKASVEAVSDEYGIEEYASDGSAHGSSMSEENDTEQGDY